MGERGGERERGRGEGEGEGGRESEREEDKDDEKGHTINKLCIIVLLLVLNYYVLSYFISFRETRYGAKQMNYVYLFYY